MTDCDDEMVLRLPDISESVFDGEVITYYHDDLGSEFINPILQPPSNDVIINLDLTENNLADLVTLSPADASSESFTLTTTDTNCFLSNSDHSPSGSSTFSWSSPENPGSILYSPSSLSSVTEENTEVMVSPSEVLHEGQAPPKKKRGRKPKSVSGSCSTSSETVKIKRLRAYEVAKPYDDKEKEKKRVNAIKAKNHRDSQKKRMQELEKQIAQVKAERDKFKMERDRIKREVESLRRKDYNAEREMQKMELEKERRKVAELTYKYEFCKRHWEAQSHQIMKLLQKPPGF